MENQDDYEVAQGFDTECYEGEEEREDPNSLPLGWRFSPTDAELITNYLRPKVNREPLPVEGIILDVDLYTDSPMGLIEKYADKGHEGYWYFFTSRTRKYDLGSRPDRGALDGFWKATGADKLIVDENNVEIGRKKTLVFYKTIYKERKRDPGTKTHCMMLEYKIEESKKEPRTVASRGKWVLDDYVLCKIYLRRGVALDQGAEGNNLQVQPLNQTAYPGPEHSLEGNNLQVQPLNQRAYPGPEHSLVPSQRAYPGSEHSLVPSQTEQPETSSQITYPLALLENPQPVQHQIPYPNVAQPEPSNPDPYSGALPEWFSDNYGSVPLLDSSTSVDGTIPDLHPVAEEDPHYWNLVHADQYNSAGYGPNYMLPPLCEPESYQQAYDQSFPCNPASMMEWDQISYGMHQQQNNYYQQQNNYYGGNQLPHFTYNNLPPGPSNYSFPAAGQPNFYNSTRYQPGSSIMIGRKRMRESQGNLDQAASMEGMKF